jgi:peroxiredoxin
MLCNDTSFNGRGRASPLKTSLVQTSKRRQMKKLKNRGLARNRRQQPLKTTKIVKTVDSVLGPGKLAPNFSLNSTPDQKVSLNDFRGQPVILAFYPADWSPVCTDQLSLYAMVMPEFKKFNAELLAISVDNIWSHLAFAKDRKLNFPVLADFEPKGSISRKYGAYKDKIGESARALFVIDEKGIIKWSHLSPDGINPGADGILSALENLNKAQVDEKS